MPKIKLWDDPKFHQESFFLIRKQSPYYVLNEHYTIKDQANNTISHKFLVSIKELIFDDIDNTISYLYKNCKAKVLKQILESKEIFEYVHETKIENAKKISIPTSKKQVLYLLVFSDKNPIDYASI